MLWLHASFHCLGLKKNAPKSSFQSSFQVVAFWPWRRPCLVWVSTYLPWRICATVFCQCLFSQGLGIGLCLVSFTMALGTSFPLAVTAQKVAVSRDLIYQTGMQ